MKVKVNEASGPVLDWMVAHCKGWERGKYMMSPDIRKDVRGNVIGIMVPNHHEYIWFNPSINWAQGGPIIDREEITIDYRDNETQTRKWVGDDFIEARAGKKQGLLAAMRCYVASKLGEEVEVPDVLLDA